MFDELVDEMFGGLLRAFVPDHPAVVYGLPTVLLGGMLAVAADPVPSLAIAVGAVLSIGLSLAYRHTGLEQESTGDGRSTADWVAVGVFFLVVVGIVLVGEVDAVSLAVSTMQILGVVTGLLAGVSVVEWLLPAVRARLGM